MKDKGNFIIDLVILFFIIILGSVVLRTFPDNLMVINALFWTILSFIIYKIKGIKKNNTEIHRSATSIIIIWILTYIIVSFLSGLYFGFLKNSSGTDITTIMHNIYSLVIMVIAEEYIREVTIRKKNNKYNLIILVILYSLLDILLLTNFSELTNGLKIFLFVTEILTPVIVRNVTSSFIVYEFGILPSIIYRTFFMIYPYLFPIYPDLGSYLTSVLSVIVPYLIYLTLSNIMDRYEHKKKINRVNRLTYVLNALLVAIILVVISLVSGIFRYKIISIASGSMEPVIDVGDAVIYEKIDNIDFVRVNDIVVFKRDGKLIAHRVLKITRKDNKRYYMTKGDKNASPDEKLLEEKDVLGVVRLRIKFIGLPSIWFQELLN